MTARPRVSVIMPHAIRHAADHLSAFARHVEDTGLDGLFTGDHLAAPIADAALTLAVAAAATTRIQIGFGVMVLALRHPAWAAKQIATLQQLSRNRVILGVGLGGAVHGTAAWDAVGVPYQDRAARTDAALRIVRGLVAGKPTELPGGAELTLAPGAPPRDGAHQCTATAGFPPWSRPKAWRREQRISPNSTLTGAAPKNQP